MEIGAGSPHPGGRHLFAGADVSACGPNCRLRSSGCSGNRYDRRLRHSVSQRPGPAGITRGTNASPAAACRRFLATDRIEIIGQGDPANSRPCATDEVGTGGFDGERFAPVCIPAKFATDSTGNAAIVLSDISRAVASTLPVEPDPVIGRCQRRAGATIEAAQAQPHDLPDYGGG